MRATRATPISKGRFGLVVASLAAGTLLLVGRAIDLQVLDRDFLQTQGDARHLRVVSMAAHRGMITDRHGEPLAISTPIDSIWVNPSLLSLATERWPELARVLEMEPAALATLLTQRMAREFVYLRRHVGPDLAARVTALQVPGVFLQREYRRYYPTGEVAAHVVGFTDVDDVGLEGMELAYNERLRGTAGAKRVIRDRLGRVVENVESIREPKAGQDLRLSLDRRLQYLAYRELKSAVQRHGAEGGSVVLLDVLTGEVLAMVNQPAYNPNNLGSRGGSSTRNRAVTDVFEPGSTIKPFTIAAALESGRFHPDTPIDTSPGTLRIGPNTIRDHRNYGVIDLATVIKKSSNVGATRIALALEPEQLWRTLRRVGFGEVSGSGFPGETGGTLSYRERDIERATLSYGYGLAVTPLQLVQAYATLANAGASRPVSFLALDGEAPDGIPALNPRTAQQVLRMLEGVITEGGTGTRASVPGYRIAGKTGTARKAGANGYTDEHYISAFAGVAPASRPRLAMVVMVDEPTTAAFYGGDVAAPVFSNVMVGALRLLDVAPDDVRSLTAQVVPAPGEVL